MKRPVKEIKKYSKILYANKEFIVGDDHNGALLVFKEVEFETKEELENFICDIEEEIGACGSWDDFVEIQYCEGRHFGLVCSEPGCAAICFLMKPDTMVYSNDEQGCQEMIESEWQRALSGDLNTYVKLLELSNEGE